MHSLAVISAHAKSTEPVYSDTSLRFVQPGRVASCARSPNTQSEPETGSRQVAREPEMALAPSRLVRVALTTLANLARLGKQLRHAQVQYDEREAEREQQQPPDRSDE